MGLVPLFLATLLEQVIHRSETVSDSLSEVEIDRKLCL